MSTGLQPANLHLTDTRNKGSYQDEDVTSVDNFTSVDKGCELGSSSPFKRHATTLSSTYAAVLCISSFGTASRLPLGHVSGPHRPWFEIPYCSTLSSFFLAFDAEGARCEIFLRALICFYCVTCWYLLNSPVTCDFHGCFGRSHFQS